MHKITERNCQHDFYSKKTDKKLAVYKKKLFLQMTIVIQIKTLDITMRENSYFLLTKTQRL